MATTARTVTSTEGAWIPAAAGPGPFAICPQGARGQYTVTTTGLPSSALRTGLQVAPDETEPGELVAGETLYLRGRASWHVVCENEAS